MQQLLHSRILFDEAGYDPWKYLGLPGGRDPFGSLNQQVKNMLASLNVSFRTLGIAVAFVTAIFYLVMMIVKKSPQARAEYKSKYLNIFILIWLLCSVTTILNIVYSVISGFI